MPLSKKRRSNPEGRMALRDHLREARNRLFICLGTLLLTSIAAAFFYQPVLGHLVGLVRDAGGQINYQTAVSTLDTAIKVSLWMGIIAASPVILFQLWSFIVPGLRPKERRISTAFICATIPLFVGGVVLGVLVIPHALRFFFSLTPSGGLNIISITDFLPFIIRLTLAFGVAMIIPVAMVGLNVIGILPARSIVKHWRVTVFLIAVFAAVAAPGGDALSMLLLAAPMLLLFGIATGLCFVFDRRKAARESVEVARTEATADTARPLEEL